MGVKLMESVDANGAHYAWLFRCPGCGCPHQCDSRWTFNGDRELPTFAGSVLVHAADHGTPEAPEHRPRCHSFVTDGRIAYCADSEHALAGQTVDLPDWDQSNG
jgi:hypothetical protein